ncbi:MAG: putative lipoprotein transrane [Polaromonas sp.]|jgi:hypothetical protein|nr:putative lipoprotein transrane [Polaromonas sp.]
MHKTSFKAITAAAVLLLASACAVQSVKPGTTRDEVIKGYGQPTNTVPLATGTRLQYSLQPLGRSVVMVDLDASGRVISAREVMNTTDFARVKPDEWTRQDVEREFGRPAMVDRVASWPGDIMTYRWRDADQPMFFYVYLDSANTVRRIGQAMEFPMRYEPD